MRGLLWSVCAWLAACASAPSEPAHPEINPSSVPSLALLGTSARGEEVAESGDGMSCEEVIDAERRRAERGEVSGEEPPPEHGDEIKAMLNTGAFLSPCNVHESASVEVCAAIIDGHAEGVTVALAPGSTDQAACVANAIRRMSFPAHPLVAVARTTFAPL